MAFLWSRLSWDYLSYLVSESISAMSGNCVSVSWPKSEHFSLSLFFHIGENMCAHLAIGFRAGFTYLKSYTNKWQGKLWKESDIENYLTLLVLLCGINPEIPFISSIILSSIAFLSCALLNV